MWLCYFDFSKEFHGDIIHTLSNSPSSIFLSAGDGTSACAELRPQQLCYFGVGRLQPKLR